MDEELQAAVQEEILREINAARTPRDQIRLGLRLFGGFTHFADRSGLTVSKLRGGLSGETTISRATAEAIAQTLRALANPPLELRHCPKCGKLKHLLAFVWKMNDALPACVSCKGYYTDEHIAAVERGRPLGRGMVKPPVKLPTRAEVSTDQLTGDLLQIVERVEEKSRRTDAKLLQIKGLKVELLAIRNLVDKLIKTVEE